MMTPEEWSSTDNPGPLLTAIQQDVRNRIRRFEVVERGLRLFVCVAARQVWDLLSTDARSAVQAAERFADGRASITDLVANALGRQNSRSIAAQYALRVAQSATRRPSSLAGSAAGPPAAELNPFSNAAEAGLDAARAIATRDVGPAPLGLPTPPEWIAGWKAAFSNARAIQAAYLRDIFPPPHYTPGCNPEWLTSTVVALARQMDESGDFSAVPILADALQDAGCTDETILACCRMPGNVHIRGNWVVDTILERQ